MPEVEIFTVVDARYFPGAVAMAATVGRHLPGAGITFLDAGLRPDQRVWLADRHRVADPSSERHPYGAKGFVVEHLDRIGPDGVVVLADADLVATGSWEPYVASARAGAVVAAIDPQFDRRFDEWVEAFGLRGPVRFRPYVNSGLVVFSLHHHAELLHRWAERCSLLGAAGGGIVRKPFGSFGDQDILNALLMTEFADTPVDVRPATEVAIGWTMPGFRSHRPRTFTARGPDGPVRVLHSVCRPKPWMIPSARQVVGPAYARILRAALEPEIRASPSGGPLAPEAVVPWLRPGPIGSALLAVGQAPGRIRLRAARALHRVPRGSPRVR